MKTKIENKEKSTEIIQGFDAVQSIRVIKEKISKDIYGMTLEQIHEYLLNQGSAAGRANPKERGR